MRGIVFRGLLPSRTLLRIVGGALFVYQKLGIQTLVRATGVLKLLKLDRVERLTPTAEMPTFFGSIGAVFPAEGERRHRVAFLAGSMANIFFARLNEATVRVLQKNGCEVVIPDAQTCCGALHVHAGGPDDARALACR